MNFNELQKHLQALAFLEEAGDPLVNCYLNVGTSYRKDLSDRIRLLKTKIESMNC